jgi:hypothetical protein
VENCLLQKDLDADNKVVRSIDAYLNAPDEGGADPNKVIDALGEIKGDAVQARPKWRNQMKRWKELISKAAITEPQRNIGD